MKYIYLLPFFVFALILSSCSSYHKDMVYTKNINIADAFVTTPNSPKELNSKEQALTSIPNSEKVVATNEVKKEVKQFLTKPLKTSKQIIVKIAQASPLQLITGNKTTVVVNKDNLAQKTSSIGGNGLFMLLLSMFVMVIGAIIMFAGFSGSQSIISIAGIVLLLLGVVLFGIAVSRIVSKS